MAQEFDFLKKEYLLSLIHHLPGMLYRCKNDNFWTMEVISDGCEDLTGFSKKDLVNNATLSLFIGTNDIYSFQCTLSSFIWTYRHRNYSIHTERSITKPHHRFWFY